MAPGCRSTTTASNDSRSRRMQCAVWLLCTLLLFSISTAAAQATETNSSDKAAAGGAGAGSSGHMHWQQTCPEALQDGRQACPLWGCHGENWKAGGLLDDWSFAGYGAGMEAIPSPPVRVDVKRDFQATGNGVTDDTAAVRAAIAATKDTGGVVYFPPGKYILSDQLILNSYQVLRGAGRDETNLRFTKSLADLRGWGQNYTAGHGHSKFTWAGAFITNQQERGVFDSKVNLHLGYLTKPARRGDTRLYVGQLVRNTSSAELLFKPGQWFTLALQENEQGDLARMLYNNKTAGGQSLRMFKNQFLVSHTTRVTAVGPDWVEIERPLHVDVNPAKHAAVLVRSANYKITGVGVEDLEVSFPWTAYMGHHEEAGYNAIEFIGSVNGWVRRVRIVNADSGVRLYGSLFNTISEIEITNSPWTRKGGRWVGRASVWQLADMDGHMGIALHWASHDNLVEKFNISGTYYHDLLVAVYSSHNVYSQGSGVDICMDHHGSAPNNNLWTDIDLGLGNGAMRWSGDGGSNPYAGKLNTFWGIWASHLPTKVDYVSQLTAARESLQKMQKAARLTLFARPADIQGYQQVVVDMPLDASMPTIKEAGDWLVHYDPDYRVYPGNLYKAMVATAGSRLRLTQNGTFLSDLFPRPEAAAAWKPKPVQHPGVQVARVAAVKPDPDCLNLGCGLEHNASWVRDAAQPSASTLWNAESSSKPLLQALPSAHAALQAVVNSSRTWVGIASKAALSLGSLGAGGGASSNSSSLSHVLASGPLTAVAAEVVGALKQVVSVANEFLWTLAGGRPQQPLQPPVPAPVATVVAKPPASSYSGGQKAYKVVAASSGASKPSAAPAAPRPAHP